MVPSTKPALTGTSIGNSRVFQRGMTVRNGSGSMFAVAYTASAVAQNTSSCVPVGW